MKSIEIKNDILGMVNKVDDPKILADLSDFVAKYLQSHFVDSNDTEEMSQEDQAELELVIEESYDEKNHVPHEVVKQKYAKWLRK